MHGFIKEHLQSDLWLVVMKQQAEHFTLIDTVVPVRTVCPVCVL